MIVITRRTTVSGLLAIALLPAACASPSPVLYTLDQVPGVTRLHGPHVVMLRDIGLAPYLDRQQIVRSSSNYRIDVEANNWWGESFGAMMIRVLTAEIDQRLPGTSVYSESGAISPLPDATVEINIQRFDTDSDRKVRLTAQLAVTFANVDRPSVSRSLQLVAVPPKPDLTGQVAAMSIAVGQLSDAVAAALTSRHQ